METTNSNDVLIDGAKVIEKWFNDSNSAFTEIYNKQLNLTTKFYDNLLKSMVGNNKNWNANNDIVDSFFKNDLMKRFSFFSSGNGNTFSGQSLTSMENTFKEMMAINRSWISTFYNQMNNSDFDWNSISKEYMSLIEKRLEASKKILNSMENSFSEGMDFSIEKNKKIIENMNNEMVALNKENKKFWSEIISPKNEKVEEEKKAKESNFNESKKRTGMAVSR
jgi:hypothetical protein